MMTRIPIKLEERDALALSKLARQEYRDIRQQAAVIISTELKRRGLISTTDAPPIPPTTSQPVNPATLA